jgi:hypothetical protein
VLETVVRHADAGRIERAHRARRIVPTLLDGGARAENGIAAESQ